jgi:7,8-dihydropterin-6-yl-methyl-4-(beta-D-ribofuranosyl)aminobenzene 5'-phosphate synthase
MTQPSMKQDTRRWITYIAFMDVWGPDCLEHFLETMDPITLDRQNIELLVPPQTLAEPHRGITGFVIFRMTQEGMREADAYLSRFEQAGVRVKLLPILDNPTLAQDLALYRQGQLEIAAEWQHTAVEKITHWGATRELTILPLVDWKTRQPNLQTEMGVAYLLQTDTRSILFDLGLNTHQQHPSPLLHNMTQLGITLTDIDTIITSHNHSDHVGGSTWSRKNTFSVTAQQLPLTDVMVYTPVPMTYPGLTPIHAHAPTIIGTGVATIGTISNQLFGEHLKITPLGRTREQAVAINVKDKGVVLIIGCGHQTLPKILKRTEALFDEPLYGVIGGLHYAVDGGPYELKGMAHHKYFGTGKLPWRPITRQELQDNIALLQSYDPKIVALSPHDSSPLSLQALQQAFPTAYTSLYVGEPIIIPRH